MLGTAMSCSNKRERHQQAEHARRARLSKAFKSLWETIDGRASDMPRRSDIIAVACDEIRKRRARLQELKEIVQETLKDKHAAKRGVGGVGDSDQMHVGARALISMCGTVLHAGSSFSRLTGLENQANFLSLFHGKELSEVYGVLRDVSAGVRKSAQLQIRCQGRFGLPLTGEMLLGLCDEIDQSTGQKTMICILRCDAESKFWCPCSDELGQCSDSKALDAITDRK